MLLKHITNSTFLYYLNFFFTILNTFEIVLLNFFKCFILLKTIFYIFLNLIQKMTEKPAI